MLCMVTFTINIPPMLAYIPYMDPMGSGLTDCADQVQRSRRNRGLFQTHERPTPKSSRNLDPVWRFFNMAIENCPFDKKNVIYLLNMVIFHSYLKLPQSILERSSRSHVLLQILISERNNQNPSTSLAFACEAMDFWVVAWAIWEMLLS